MIRLFQLIRIDIVYLIRLCRLRLCRSGSLMNLYGPTFHDTPID